MRKDSSELSVPPIGIPIPPRNCIHIGTKTSTWWAGRDILAANLVVEDELLLSWDISETLEGEGYDVIAVANADEAIKVLESRNDIRTIFTDIDLPGSMDGLKLAAAVRDRWPPVHIIVTTGMRAPHRDEMPANSMFISKPYRSAEVLEAVRSFDNALP